MDHVDFAKNTERFLESSRAFNKLVFASADQVMELQLESARRCYVMALDSLKGAAAVKDAQGAKSYLLRRLVAARKLGETLAADGEELVKLGSEYAEGVQEIVGAGLNEPSKRAA